MENTNTNPTRRTVEAVPPIHGDKAGAVSAGQALPPEVLAPRLADLKRQLALRMAMP